MNHRSIRVGLLITMMSLTGIAVTLLFVFLFPRPFIQFIPEQITNPFESEKLFFLVLGIDNAGEAGSDRTDAIMLAGLNTVDGSFELVSIPRDLIVTDPENPSEKLKINALFKNEGIQQLEKKIEQIMGVHIERFAIIDYQLFEYLGDLVGPVEIMIEEAMHYEDNQQDLSINFDRGRHLMYGEDLLKYIRFRNDSKGDLGRLERQKAVVMKLFSLLKGKLSVNFLETEFTNLLDQMQTDFTVKDVIYTFLKLGNLDTIEFFSYPYTIAGDGSLYSDEVKLKELKGAFLNFEKIPQTASKQIICILNCTDQTPRVFSIVSYNRIHSSGLAYFLLDTPLTEELYSKKIKNNTLMRLNGKTEEALVLQKQLEELYETDFDMIDISEKENLDFYYSVISHYLNEGIFYPTPLEALVFIREQ